MCVCVCEYRYVGILCVSIGRQIPVFAHVRVYVCMFLCVSMRVCVERIVYLCNICTRIMYTLCVGFCNICSVCVYTHTHTHTHYIYIYMQSIYVCMYVVCMQYLGTCRPIMPIVPVMSVYVRISHTHKNPPKPITSTVYNL